MKRIYLITTIALFIGILFTSCSKDENEYKDELPELTGAYIAMKVDGKWWVSERAKLPAKNSFIVSSYKWSESNNYSMSITGNNSNNFDKNLSYFSIDLTLTSQAKVGVYSLPLYGNWNQPFEILIGFLDPYVGSNGSGSVVEPVAFTNNKSRGLPFKVNITKATIYPNAPLQAFLSGTFEGDLKKEDGTIVKITEGRFQWE